MIMNYKALPKNGAGKCRDPTILRLNDELRIRIFFGKVDSMCCSYKELIYKYGDNPNEYFSTCQFCGQTIKYYYVPGDEYIRQEIIDHGGKILQNIKRVGASMKLSNQDEEKIIERYKAGEKVKPIIRSYDIKEWQFYEIMKRRGVILRQTIDKAILLYNAGDSKVEICNILGITEADLQTILADKGILDIINGARNTHDSPASVDDQADADPVMQFETTDNANDILRIQGITQSKNPAIDALVDFLPPPGTVITTAKERDLINFFNSTVRLLYICRG